MALEMFCGPSLLYLGFSIIQIIIDIYKGLYNTTFIKFIVMILFTVFLNILCKTGLTVVSWLIVFIPFISMTVITTLLLFVFGLDPSQGNLNYQIMNYNTNFSSTVTGQWTVVYPNGNYEEITVTEGIFVMLGQPFQLLNTNPISFRWADGTVHIVDNINSDGLITWSSNDPNTEYSNIIWIPVYMQNQMSNNMSGSIDPCPPNVTPDQYRKYYGGFCMTGTQLNNFTSNSSGSFRVLYYDGFTEIITLNNGSFISQGVTYKLLDTDPITILWPDGTIQTLDTIGNNFIRWKTNSSEEKYSIIIWEPINGDFVNNNGISNLASNPTSSFLPNMSSISNNFNTSALSACISSCNNTCNNNPNKDSSIDCSSYCGNECNKLF